MAASPTPWPRAPSTSALMADLTTYTMRIVGAVETQEEPPHCGAASTLPRLGRGSGPASSLETKLNDNPAESPRPLGSAAVCCLPVGPGPSASAAGAALLAGAEPAGRACWQPIDDQSGVGNRL